MTPTEFSQRLLRAAPGSPEAAALARDLVEDARFPAHVAIENYLSSTKTPEQMKAKDLLMELAELSVVPLGEAAPLQDLATEVWALRSITRELLALRRRDASVLMGLLGNGRAAPPRREGGAAAQAALRTRVCDLAYVLLQRMLHLEPASTDFLSLPRDVRDKRIKELQESRALRAVGAP